LNLILDQQKLIDFRFKTQVFDSEGALELAITSTTKDTICFAVVFNDWSPTHNNYDISLRYATIVLPSTNVDAYSDLQVAPNLQAWDQWRTSGALQV
jgi:hypothetical protein